MGGNAVIDGENQLRKAAFRRQLVNNARRQAIAVGKAAGDTVIHRVRPETGKPEDRQGGAGGAIGIKIAHNRNTLPLRHRAGEGCGRSLQAKKPLRTRQRSKAIIQLGGIGHAPRRIEAPQQRVEVGTRESVVTSAVTTHDRLLHRVSCWRSASYGP